MEKSELSLSVEAAIRVWVFCLHGEQWETAVNATLYFERQLGERDFNE